MLIDSGTARTHLSMLECGHAIIYCTIPDAALVKENRQRGEKDLFGLSVAADLEGRKLTLTFSVVVLEE